MVILPLLKPAIVTVRQLSAITTSAYDIPSTTITLSLPEQTNPDSRRRALSTAYSRPGLLALGEIHQYLEQEDIMAAHALLRSQ